MSKDQYFEMCEMLGTEPVDSEIPIDLLDFPSEIQEALRIFNQLADRWDSMSGIYFGKDYTLLPFLVELYKVDDVHNLFLFLTVAESTLSEIYSNDIQIKRAAKEQSAKNSQARRK